MKVVEINGEVFLAESVVDKVAVKAMKVSKFNKVTSNAVNAYAMAKNEGVLTDVTFDNAVFKQRDLTPVENGLVTVADAMMVEAKKFALSRVENEYFRSLGE